MRSTLIKMRTFCLFAVIFVSKCEVIEAKQQTLVASSSVSSKDTESYVLTQEVLDTLFDEALRVDVARSLLDEAIAVNNDKPIRILAKPPSSGNSGASSVTPPVTIMINPNVRLPDGTPRTVENIKNKVLLTLIYELGNCARAADHRRTNNCICTPPLCTGEVYADHILYGESYGYLKRASFFYEKKLGGVAAFQQMFNNKANSELAYRLATRSLTSLPMKPKEAIKILKARGVPNREFVAAEVRVLVNLLNEHMDEELMRLIMFNSMKGHGRVRHILAVDHYKALHANFRFSHCKARCKPSGEATGHWHECL